MHEFAVLRVAVKQLVPFIWLFALYVQTHGDYGPGGGFQAGVIFASGFVLYGLVYGVGKASRIIQYRPLIIMVAAGVLVFSGTGVWSLFSDGNFLEYGVFADDSVAGNHLGIFVIELGVGITVAAVMTAVYFAFAGRQR